MPGNKDIWELITLLPGQWRVSMAGAYALDMPAFLLAAGSLGMAADRLFLQKLAAYAQEALSLMKEAGDICDAGQKGKCLQEFGEFLEWACGTCERRTTSAGEGEKEHEKLQG